MTIATAVRMANVQNVVLAFTWINNFASLVLGYVLNVAVLRLAPNADQMSHNLILTGSVSAFLVLYLTALGSPA